MRILTPTELREIQRLKDDLARFVNPNSDTLTVQIPYEKREMWLNVLTVALQANDALSREWSKYEVVNQNVIERALVN